MENKNNLTKNLKKLEEISNWFEKKDDVDIEEGIEKVKEAVKIIKESKKRLKEVENEFEEIKKDLNSDEN